MDLHDAELGKEYVIAGVETGGMKRWRVFFFLLVATAEKR